MDRREFEAFLADLQAERRAEQEARRQRQNRRASARQFGSRPSTTQRRRSTGATAATASTEEAGFLFHKKPARVQEGRQSFRRIWGDRPRVPNWRRREAISGSESPRRDEAVAGAGDERQDGDPAARGGRPETGRRAAASAGIDVSAVPRDSSSRAAMRDERAVARYELANALFLQAGRPDSAATWYRRILEEDADHPVARRALYALAEAHAADGDTTAARRRYRAIVDRYPNSPHAERARAELGGGVQVAQVDSTALADSVYRRAYRAWTEGRLGHAMHGMHEVVARFADTPAAPRAALAACTIYWRWVTADSVRKPEPRSPAPRRPSPARDTPPADTLRAATGRTDTLRSGSPRASGPRADSLRADSSRARPPRPSLEPLLRALGPADTSAAGPGSTDGRGRPSPARSRAGLGADPAGAPSADRAREPGADESDALQVRPDAPPSPNEPPNEDTLRTAGGPADPAGADTTATNTTATDTPGTESGNDAKPDGAAAGPAGAATPAGDAASAGRMQAAVDSLRLLLQRLAARYPDAPQSRRAEAMLSVLEERARPDSSAEPAPGSVASADPAAGTAAQPPSPRPTASDTSAAGPSTPSPSQTSPSQTSPSRTPRSRTDASRPGAADTTAADTTAADTAAAPGASGAWAIVAAQPDRRAAADSLADQVRVAVSGRRTVSVVPVRAAEGEDGESPGRFRVTVGPYDSRRRAAADLQRLRSRYPEARVRRHRQPSRPTPRR
jgi:tetratricopeptide (TPR) repeat protein